MADPLMASFQESKSVQDIQLNLVTGLSLVASQFRLVVNVSAPPLASYVSYSIDPGRFPIV
jgi:hypothetical protein